MGRREYSDEERAQMVDIFLRATRKIIDSEGINSVSIRKVATAAGYHSSTLYLYFRNLDELVTFACMGYLVGYCRKMADAAPQMRTPRDVYYKTWEIFCNCAFESPQVFQQLFFSEHDLPLGEMVKRYYKVYPHQLDSMDVAVTEMLTAGELDDRNIHILRPLAAELGFEGGDLIFQRRALFLQRGEGALLRACQVADGLLRRGEAAAPLFASGGELIARRRRLRNAALKLRDGIGELLILLERAACLDLRHAALHGGKLRFQFRLCGIQLRVGALLSALEFALGAV